MNLMSSEMSTDNLFQLLTENFKVWHRDYMEQQNRTREIDLIERIVRVESSIESLNQRLIEGFEAMDKRFEAMDKRFEDLQYSLDKRFEAMDKRFEAMDKRFEAVQHSMDKRFEDMQHSMDKRFEQVDKRFTNMQWFMGFGITLITVLMSVYNFLG